MYKVEGFLVTNICFHKLLSMKEAILDLTLLGFKLNGSLAFSLPIREKIRFYVNIRHAHGSLMLAQCFLAANMTTLQ